MRREALVSMARFSGWVVASLFSLGLAGCTPPYAVPSGTLPTPSTAPGVVTLSPASLSFLTAGASAAQSVSPSQANYSGPFAALTTTCAGIATISPASGSAFTVTPVAAGTCSFTVTGSGASATLGVTVTTTSVGGT